MFWVVLQHLVAAKCTVAKSDPRMPFWHEFRPMKLFSILSAKMHPMHSIWSKAHVLGCFAPFGSCKCTVAKSGPRMPFGHELGPMKLFLSFLDKTHPIHYFRSKTHVLGGFPPFDCRKYSVVKSGHRMPFWHEFGPTKLLSCFSAKAHPIHDFRSKTHVLGCFEPFGSRKYTVAKSGPEMPFGHEFGPMKLLSSFTTKTHPIHYFRSKTNVLGGFAPFGCRKWTVTKSGPRMPFGHEFGPMKLLSSFLAKMHPIHYFRSKTHVLGGFAPFGYRRCTVAKSGPRMSFWHEFRPTKLFSRFSTKTHPINYVMSETHVLGGFAPFGSGKCSFAKSGTGMLFWHEFGLTKLLSSFLAKMHPIHYFTSKTHILGGFTPFGCSKCTIAKSGPEMPFGIEFVPM